MLVCVNTLALQRSAALYELAALTSAVHSFRQISETPRAQLGHSVCACRRRNSRERAFAAQAKCAPHQPYQRPQQPTPPEISASLHFHAGSRRGKSLSYAVLVVTSMRAARARVGLPRAPRHRAVPAACSRLGGRPVPAADRLPRRLRHGRGGLVRSHPGHLPKRCVHTCTF